MPLGQGHGPAGTEPFREPFLTDPTQRAQFGFTQPFSCKVTVVVKGDFLIFLWKLRMRSFNVTSPAKRGEQAGKARQGKPRMLEGT